MFAQRMFARWPLVSPVRLSFGEDEMFKYTLHVLMGLHPRRVDHQSRQRLLSEHVYMRIGNDRYLDLYPFLRYTTCTTCRTTSLFLLDNIGHDRIHSKAFCNHVIESDSYPLLKRRLQRV